jgi:hypothetical protein
MTAEINAGSEADQLELAPIEILCFGDREEPGAKFAGERFGYLASVPMMRGMTNDRGIHILLSYGESIDPDSSVWPGNPREQPA